jgi:hypothetical protein
MSENMFENMSENWKLSENLKLSEKLKIFPKTYSSEMEVDKNRRHLVDERQVEERGHLPPLDPDERLRQRMPDQVLTIWDPFWDC